jgi:hypothetical protein
MASLVQDLRSGYSYRSMAPNSYISQSSNIKKFFCNSFQRACLYRIRQRHCVRAKWSEVRSGFVSAVCFLFDLEIFLNNLNFFPTFFKLTLKLFIRPLLVRLVLEKGWGLTILNIPTAVRIANQTRRTNSHFVRFKRKIH